MRLIGMLDSPYVRRVAISLRRMGLPFTHESTSVFRHYDVFAATNPVVKAPTLVTDAGVVLMDSTLILDYADRLVPSGRRLSPEGVEAFARHQRIVGLALAGCEKTVQIVYEHELRPEERRHAPWLSRIRGQLGEAYRLLEAEMGDGGWLFGEAPLQADITAAVAWSFTHHMRPGEIDLEACPRLATLAARAEALEDFQALPIS
ncbi:glutathione S-transferase family protein [Ancylobacter terrae]|uniref:glutathione S-transferase family protein n=1 Tax=Ancylobacter sp. sgz301288 TaxID=3342077 RepID=UPI0038592E1D